MRQKLKEYAKHETKRHLLKKFVIIVMILIAYVFFSVLYYGVSKGILISLLTWSFFVFCTPIADAGFLVDFPIRVLTNFKMIFSEALVWTIAFSLNAYSLLANPKIYDESVLLRMFKVILTNPWPYWIIIFLSFLGTFLSVYFSDEMVDVFEHRQREKYKKHKKKYLLVLVIAVVIIVFLYYKIIKYLGLRI